MMLSHGHTDRDPVRLVGDALLGIIWVVFVWTLLGEVLSSDCSSAAWMTRFDRESSPLRH